MGWMKDQKAGSLARDAQAAWEEGSQYFTPVLNFPALKLGFSGRVKDWEPMLEAVGSVGWVLHTWAVAIDDKGRPQAMPLFTRPL